MAGTPQQQKPISVGPCQTNKHNDYTILVVNVKFHIRLQKMSFKYFMTFYIKLLRVPYRRGMGITRSLIWGRLFLDLRLISFKSYLCRKNLSTKT